MTTPVSLKGMVLGGVQRALPEADLTDPTRGQAVGPGWTIELNSARMSVDAIMLRVRGSGRRCPRSDLSPGQRTGPQRHGLLRRGTDGSPTEASGWHAFQGFCDRVTGAR